MTNSELNKCILHYLTQNQTRSAVMLTGSWGTGKSYYIQHDLIPFLEKEENDNYKCITISMYGISNLAEVSKSLYMESRVSRFNKNSEALATGKFIARTVLKGIASHFSIDLEPSEDEWKQLYDSVNLSGKLLIFEDIERIQFGLIEFLGYINSLVEQDGVKVLLVANENEIIRYKPFVATVPANEETGDVAFKTIRHQKPEHTEETAAYFKAKEKTVSDTFRFEGDVSSAIRSIIEEFHDDTLGLFARHAEIEEIKGIMKECNSFNLRSFQFACQKASDIYQLLPAEIDRDPVFEKAIFMGIILYSLRVKASTKCDWDREVEISPELGNRRYPLFRFCYDYIVYHIFKEDRVIPAQKAYKEYRLYDENMVKDDPDMVILSTWYVQQEAVLRKTVNQVTERLKTIDSFPFCYYGELAYYLVKVSSVIKCDVSKAKERLINNLYKKGEMINKDSLYLPLSDNEDQEIVNEFEKLIGRMSDALGIQDGTLFGFSYRPEDIKMFLDKTIKNVDAIIADGAFASRLDIKKIVEMLKQCSAYQINDFRGAFLTVYHENTNIRYMRHDKISLEELLDAIQTLQDYGEYDRVQQKQIEFFVDNLKKALSAL